MKPILTFEFENQQELFDFVSTMKPMPASHEPQKRDKPSITDVIEMFKPEPDKEPAKEPAKAPQSFTAGLRTYQRRQILEDIPCEYCGKIFTPRRKDSKACSAKCTNLLWLKKKALSKPK